MMPADHEELMPKVDSMNLSVQNPTTETSQKTEDVYLFPTSMEQHRYWILDQVDKASTASNMAITWRLVGAVDDMLVEKSICALTLRHEALRTTFRMIDGTLNQVISEEPLYRFSVSDITTTPEEERSALAERLIREDSHVAMNLATGPLFLTHLIHVSDSEHFLSCTMHHIVCDGWSNGILVRDFAEFYSAYSQDRSPELPELPFQFADFTVWQKEWLVSEAAQDAIDFWREQIQHGTPAIDLPTDYPRSARKDGPGHIESHLLSQSLNERLKQFCRDHDATNHQVLLAAFQCLIARYTGQDQFLLGSSIANRTQPGMDNVVGRFANPQVIVANVTEDPRFDELLRRVSEWSTSAYAHQDLPFSRLMEEFQLDQSGATSQFLQMYFVYQKAFMQPQSAGELGIVPRPSISGGVNFDFLVSIVERAEGPRLQIEYNTDLFRKERVQDFIQQYIRVLTAVLDDPALRVSQLPLLTSDEELALSRTGQGIPSSRTCASTLVEAFDYHAVRLGDATAVIAGGERISWKALADKSRQLARALQEIEVLDGKIVALRMEANVNAAAGALAVLRAGGIVLPIPASTSTDEWTCILSQIEPSLSLAGADFSRSLPGVVNLDDLDKAGQDVDLPLISATAPAWCGLSIDQSNRYQTHLISNNATTTLVSAASQALQLEPGDVVAVKPSPASVDAWIDIFLPLISGASIFYLTDVPADQLQAVIDREQIGFAFATTPEWLEILSRGWSGDRRLKMICRGGRLPLSASKQLLSAGRLWSLISSTAVGGPISLAFLEKEETIANPANPLPGQSFMILDTFNNIVPEGVMGELSLSGAGLLTRTGFLARYGLSHGFEIVDRVQNSVFLNRSRLRLGDLEDRLLAAPGVSHAKAAICSDENETATLTAFISGVNGTHPHAGDVSQFLRSTTPGYLSCAELVSVDTITLRADGSPDSTGLLQSRIEPSSEERTGDYVPPRDEIETKLVKIWEDVLGVKGLGIRTSFFSLGGYSLMIVRLFAQINKALNASLPLTTIFNAPTIEQLADILRGRKAYSSIVPVKTKGTKPPFFMILSYLLYGSLPDALGKDYPFYGLRELDNEENMAPAERAASYVKAIRSVQPEGPYYLGGWCAAGPITIEVGRQLEECGQKVGLITLFDAWYPGYAEQLKQELKESGHVTLYDRLRRRYDFHRTKLRNQTTADQVRYLKTTALNKLRSIRDAVYLKHYTRTTRIFKALGRPLPDFMYNVSETTLMSLQQYEPQSFPGNMLLIRATSAPSLPGADPTCGWNQVVEGTIDVAWVQGDHETMFLEPNLEEVGKTLRDNLEKAYQNFGE